MVNYLVFRSHSKSEPFKGWRTFQHLYTGLVWCLDSYGNKGKTQKLYSFIKNAGGEYSIESVLKTIVFKNK